MPQTNQPLRISIAGLGTVGCGVLDLLDENSDIITARAGREISISAVSARDRHRDRTVDVSAFDWRDNPNDLADPALSDIVIELIGGADGPAYSLVKTALESGIHIITANKALMATHGGELARLAESTGAELRFEAAIAGGIPIVKALREGLAANRIEHVQGILNGTCNYILTLMEATGISFEDALASAQKEGYAEADPGFDIDGIDAAHKTALLAALAYGYEPLFDELPVDGIRAISQVDLAYSDELGYRIRLLGVAREVNGCLDQRVQPCLIPAGSALAKVGGAFNAVQLRGNQVGPTVLEGAGAGAGPTASAVVADIIDVARGRNTPVFGIPANQLRSAEPMNIEHLTGSYYLRLRVVDRPGVVADVAAALRDHDISIERLIQRGESPNGGVYLILTTHETSEHAVGGAVADLEPLDAVLEPPCVLRIEA